MAKRKKKQQVNQEWLNSVREEMLEAGFDPMFTECTLDELREGAAVTVYIADGLKTFDPAKIDE